MYTIRAIKELGKNLLIEARSKEDGIIEAIRYHKPESSPGKERNSKEKDPYVFGVQWHPEYQAGKENLSLMDSKPILEDFFQKIVSLHIDNSPCKSS